MKYLLIILIFNLSLLACAGDCMRCHPKLLATIDEDERHKPMLGCIKCHKPNPKSEGACGDKCFSCHSKADIDDANVAEHDIIEECRDCHVGEIQKVFDTSLSTDQSHSESMKDFLLH